MARKSHNAVNVITAIAVGGVAVSAAAMVVVLSIFNGFADLASAHLSAIDPPLLVERADGRVITGADTLAAALQCRADVRVAVPTLNERALVVTPTAQTPVRIKGVGTGYANLTGVEGIIIDGCYAPTTSDGRPSAQIAVGVANELLQRPGPEAQVDVYVPRRRGRINPANPMAAFRGAEVTVSGVFQVDQPDIDADLMLVPLSTARDLLAYDGGEASAIEVAPANGADTRDVKRALQTELGAGYQVLDRLEQRAETFRMISVEKWITFMLLVFVLVMTLFNIVSTLSLLVIEKRGNMLTLRACGASGAMVRRIFIIEGWLIAAAGGIIGIVVGVALTLAQQYGQFVKLAGNASQLSIDAYPVRLAWPDIGLTVVAVAITGLLTAQVTRLFIRKLKT